MTSSCVTRRAILAVSLLLFLSLSSTHGWSVSSTTRRDLFRVATSSMTAAVGVMSICPAQNALAAESVASLKEELVDSKSKLKEIPALLQAEEWEKVRQILKTPPVNKLWNLGDSQNTVLKIAKETGDVELFELKDELAYNLQITDQLTYDNVFVYFQPGSGKIKIKEPTDSANKAMQYLDELIAGIN